MKNFLIFILVFIASFNDLVSQKNEKKSEDKSKIKDYKKVVDSTYITDEGLFKVHTNKEK